MQAQNGRIIAVWQRSEKRSHTTSVSTNGPNDHRRTPGIHRIKFRNPASKNGRTISLPIKHN